jgi:hypothetical protein
MLLAQNLDEIQSGGLPGFKITGFGSLLSDIYNNYVFYIAGILLLIYLVMAGLQFMLSRGDPKAMQAAQAKITNALIGFVIILLAVFLVRILGLMLNISVFGSLFGNAIHGY